MAKPNPELSDAVRHWVHFDNLSETLTKQVTNARTMRSKYEDKVLTILDSMPIKNVALEINGATLVKATKKESSNLSWTLLEKALHEYYKTKGRTDETDALIEHIQTCREVKIIEFLKKSTPTAPGSLSGTSSGSSSIPSALTTSKKTPG
jgi:hypothetical protein